MYNMIIENWHVKIISAMRAVFIVRRNTFLFILATLMIYIFKNGAKCYVQGFRIKSCFSFRKFICIHFTLKKWYSYFRNYVQFGFPIYCFPNLLMTLHSHRYLKRTGEIYIKTREFKNLWNSIDRFLHKFQREHFFSRTSKKL